MLQRFEQPRLIDFYTHVFKAPDKGFRRPYREGVAWRAPWNPSDGFHVYGCRWTEERITWYVDGEFVFSRKNDYWHQPLDIALSVGLRHHLGKLPDPTGFPTWMEVDYVRVWRLVHR